MGTVATPHLPPPNCSSCGPTLESLTDIDIRKLSQSELYALSMCSDSAFDLHRTDDIVLPNIDRSLFNESAGSRRQTYSLLRDNRHHHHPRTRLPGLLPGTKLSPSSDPENHSILHFLKHYVDHNSSSSCPPPPTPPILPPQPVVVPGDLQHQLGLGLQEKMALAVHVVDKKRKRVQKEANRNKGLLENGVGIEIKE